MRQLCDSHAYDHPAIFFVQNDHLNYCEPAQSACGLRALYGHRAMLLQRVYRLQAYDFYFLYNAELNKVVEPTATLRHPRNRRILYGLCTEATLQWEFRHRTGAVSSS